LLIEDRFCRIDRNFRKFLVLDGILG